MKRLLLFTLTLAMLTVANVQQVRAYSTDDLTSAGWTQVTDMTSMTLSDYYFILIDAGSSLYSVSNSRPGTDSKPTYQTLQDPISDAGQVWKISNDGSAYYLQSLVDGWYFIGARNANQGWTDYMAAESTNGSFAFAVTDGKFSITSVFANGLVGPWEDADHVNLNYKLHWNALEDNFYEELACNKGTEHAPGFYIYAISRATYDNIRRSSNKLAANGWTQVTGTDQLGKSGYYYTLIDVSETGYESGLVMAGGTGRPNYQAMNISSNNKIQLWTMASKGEGYQMKNCESDTYVFCNDGADWNTGFTNDADNQYTEFRFTLNNGFWVISNVNSLERSLGRWSNSPYRPGTGENIAANKADNEGKRQFLIYSIPSIILDKPEGKMNATVQRELNAAYEAFLANPSDENTATVNEKIAAAKASIAVYQQIATLFTEQQMGSIQGWTDAKVYTDYNDGVYETLQQALDAYKTYVANYWRTNTPGENADLTGFITNQGFEMGDLTGWDLPKGYSADTGIREHNEKVGNYIFNSWWYGKPVVQSIANLPNGTYRLTAAFAGGDNAESPSLVFLTANENHSDVFEATGEGDPRPLHDFSFDFVVTDSTVTIGAIGANADGTWNEDGHWWYRADNFRLTYLSAEATIAPEPVNAPMNDSIRTAQQTAFDNWNANKTMDNYNALLAAIEAAQASADKYVIIDQRIPKLDAQSDGKVTEDALKAKYNSGEYVEADDVFKEYRNLIAAYYATNAPTANDDLTEFIINPSFEFGDTSGWGHADPNTTDTGARDANNDTYKFTNSDGNWVFNTWGADFLWVVQQLTGLPQGTYELSAVFAAENDRTIEFTAENVQPDGTINEKKLTFMPRDISGYYGKETGIPQTIQFMVSDGTLKIGAHANGFFKVDNFQLKFISPDFIDDIDSVAPMNMYEKENYKNALAAYNANPTKELLRDLIEKKVIVENSIKAYAAADSTLKRVKAMMSKTNVYTYDAYFTIDDMYRKYGPEEGFYGFRILEDDVAYDLERMFFGSGFYRNYDSVYAANPKWLGDIPAVPFIASAWDCGNNGYAYRGRYEGDKSWQEGDDYYANTWSTEGIDDGTNMLNPYLEYWLYGDQLLAPRTMTATVEGTPGKEYSVKMFVRVRTNQPYFDEANDPNHENPITAAMPKGMSIQIGDGTPVVPNWQFIDNRDSYYKLNNENQLWVCNLWDYAEENLPKGYVDNDGKLRIKFIIGNESNVTWLSMKDVYVNYNGENLDEIKAQVAAEVAYAKAHFVDNLGFDTNDYAPYTNVDELTTYKRASQVNDASWNYFLLKSVYAKLYEYNHKDDKGTWTKNTREMNGFYWKNDYTADDVKHVEWYEYQDDCITPSGWDLIGREDGFSTGIKKLGVNTDDTSMLALPDSTGLLTKYETSYGEQLGYTLPLKKGVKYIMTFKYAYMGEGECPEPTDITLKAGTGWAMDDTEDSHLGITQITPQGQGTDKEDLINWKMYRATFTPTIENVDNPGKPVNYLITFDKDNTHDPEPVMLGELTLVRYKEDAELGDAQRHINGTNQTGYSYTPDFVGGNFQVTRPWYTKAYNTLVLPFTLDGSELKEALGENFNGKVYFYTGAINTGGEYYQLQFEARKNGGIFANVPVMIWNPEGSSINALSQKTFNRTVTRYVDNDTNDDNHPTIFDADGYDFVGTYETIKIPVGASYIHSDNTFHKSTGKANLAATRAYFIPLDMKGDLKAGAKLMGFSIDEVPTGIVAIEEDGEMHVTSGNIYTVDGRLVRANATTLEGLPSGTYVVDGKKYFVK